MWDEEFAVLNTAQEAELTRMIDRFYKQALESLRRLIEKERRSNTRKN